MGKDDFNQALSLQRAEAVRDYLVEFGMDPAILTVEGRGDAEPLVPDNSAEGRAVNRRVDILLHPAQRPASTDVAALPPAAGSAQ